MKRREFLVSSALGAAGIAAGRRRLSAIARDGQAPGATRKILIAGGNFGEAFIRYMATLTGKPRPRLCYLPTASADSQSGIIAWYRSCAQLNVTALVQESFIASTRQTQSWEEVFLSMDGIAC